MSVEEKAFSLMDLADAIRKVRPELSLAEASLLASDIYLSGCGKPSAGKRQ